MPMATLDAPTLAAYTAMNARHSMNKTPANAACWNWALFGPVDQPPNPSMLSSYVNRNHDAAIQRAMRNEATEQFATNTRHMWDNLQPNQPLRKSLDGIRRGYDAGPDDTATRNAIRDAVFEVSILTAGFTVSAAATPYRICMFEEQDVVMWDHWWLEINGAVVETVPDNPLYAYSNVYLAPAFNHPRDRFNLRTAADGLSLAMQARVHARYVTTIQATQAAYLMLLHSA
jgi:hypothetical protein